MRTDLHAQAAVLAAEAGMVAAWQAMILTLLARLLARLETMIAQWQAGQLPKPPARSRKARPACEQAPSARPARRARTRLRPPGILRGDAPLAPEIRIPSPPCRAPIAFAASRPNDGIQPPHGARLSKNRPAAPS
jgi:hypothetical protein